MDSKLAWTLLFLCQEGDEPMLIDKLLFSDRTPLLLQKTLDFETQRNTLISSNISNINTPGYKAQDLDFHSQLKDALKSTDDLTVRSTHSQHLGPSNETLSQMRPEIFEEDTAARSDGNNVDLDKEMSKLAENQIMYNAAVQLLAKRGSIIRAAITEIAQQ